MTHRDGFPRFSARSAWRGDAGASQAMRDAVRKPWETAVPVAQANRRRASESLDDVPHRPRLASYPADRLPDLYGSLSALPGISPYPIFGRGEHGSLGLVGQVQFGKDRHLLSPSLLFVSTVAPTIEKSIGTRHEGGRRSAFMCLESGRNLPFGQECRLWPRFLPLYPQVRTWQAPPTNVSD